MGRGSEGPKPYTQHRASTIFLRIPAVDWVSVIHGNKTEFRAAPNAVTGVDFLELPTPVVAYRANPKSTNPWDAKLMVLEESWVEPLGAISEASLEREGFPDLAHFRRYWMGRTRRRFRPLQKVRAYIVRPWHAADWEMFAEVFMDRLYGEFKP